MGNQIRGFGYLNDGSTDTVFRFLSAAPFAPTGNSGFPQNNPDATRRDVEQFLLAYDSDLAPVVGQQVTLTAANGASVGPRIDLLIARAGAPFVSKSLNGAVTECDLVAQVALNGRVMGFLWDAVARNFIPDDGSGRLSDATLRSYAATAGQEITYTAATPGLVRALHLRTSNATFAAPDAPCRALIFAGGIRQLPPEPAGNSIGRRLRSAPALRRLPRRAPCRVRICAGVIAAAGREVHCAAPTVGVGCANSACASSARTFAAPDALCRTLICSGSARWLPPLSARRSAARRLRRRSAARTAFACHLPRRLPRRTVPAER